MSLVSLEVSGSVATITITPRDGRYDRALMGELQSAADRVAGDDDVRVVVLASEADFGIGWTADALAEPAGVPGLPRVSAAIDAVAGVRQPVVAALRGQIASAGLELALAADIRVAAEDSRFSMPDTQAGGVPLAGGTQRLPRAIGRASALWMLLLGEEIDAAEALRIGLVSRVTPVGSVDASAREIADVIAQRGPIATRLAKEAVHRGVEMPLAEALRYELDLTVLLQSTADRAEGVRAFAEKRPPRFIGR